MTSDTRRSWTLVAGPRYHAPDLGAVEGVVAGPAAATRVRATYYDTADLRILRWGGELRLEAGHGWFVSLGTGERGALHVERERRFAASPTVPAGALDLLTGFTRGAACKPVLHTRTDRHDVGLASAEGALIGRLRDDLVTVMEGRRIAARFREIVATGVGVNGEGTAMGAVVAALCDSGAVPAHLAPTAVRAIGAPANAPPDVAAPRVSRHDSAAVAIRAAIAASVSRLILHDAAVRDGSDPEGVHQARVATRRLRSDLRTFLPLLDPVWTEHLRDQLREIADLLGAVRDTDVLLGRLRSAAGSLSIADQAAAGSALEALQRDRDRARIDLLAWMRSRRYTALLDDLVAAANDPHTSSEASGDAAVLLPPLAAGPWRKLRRLVRELGPDPEDAELHQVRIRAKRARYAAEAVTPVARHAVAGFADAVAGVQEVLGEHADAVVAEAWLRRAGDTTDPMVLGELVGLQRAAAAAARAAWPRAWKAAQRAHPRSWT